MRVLPSLRPARDRAEMTATEPLRLHRPDLLARSVGVPATR